MFKENKQFWLYFLGIILFFFLIFYVLKNGFSGSSLLFSSLSAGNFTNVATSFPLSGYKVDVTKNYQAIIKTSRGDITIELYAKNAPNTVSNFVYLANNNFYDHSAFHRLILGFLLQGGSGEPNAENGQYGGPDYKIPDEINWDSLDYSSEKKQELSQLGYVSSSGIKSIPLTKYTVAMATNGPNTGGSQFFIVLANSNDPRLTELEGKHTVFGHVIGGFTVLNDLVNIKLLNADSDSPIPVDFTINDVVIQIKE